MSNNLDTATTGLPDISAGRADETTAILCVKLTTETRLLSPRKAGCFVLTPERTA